MKTDGRMEYIGRFLNFVVEVGHEVAPSFFKDPRQEFFFLQIVQMTLLFVGIGLYIGIFQLIKNKKTRIKMFALSSAVVANALTLSIRSDCAPFWDGRRIAGLVVLNGLFIVLAFVGRYAKSMRAEAPRDFKKDLKLSTQPKSVLGILNCPVCGKRTISRINVQRIPQTCGECGQTIRSVSSHFRRIGLGSTIFFGSLFAILYLQDVDSISHWTGQLWMVSAVAVSLVILLWPLKLVQEQI